MPRTGLKGAILARHFAALSRDERARTLGPDPTLQGRQEVTDTSCAAFVIDGTLRQDAMVATVLESRELTRPRKRLTLLN